MTLKVAGPTVRLRQVVTGAGVGPTGENACIAANSKWEGSKGAPHFT